jgi:hypothetical protein
MVQDSLCTPDSYATNQKEKYAFMMFITSRYRALTVVLKLWCYRHNLQAHTNIFLRRTRVGREA